MQNICTKKKIAKNGVFLENDIIGRKTVISGTFSKAGLKIQKLKSLKGRQILK